MMSTAGGPRAVIFDLDGTLLDSLPLVLAAITHAVEPFGGSRPTRDIFATLGGPPEKFMPTLIRDLARVPEAIARMERYHTENTHLIQPFAGAADLLDALRMGGVRAAIWTGRDRRSTEVLLARHGLAGHFATVVCGDDLLTHKPDPEGLREILRRLEVAPAEALFLGDADVDVLGGVACGVDTILIRHEREIEAHIIAHTWRQAASPAEAYALVRARLGVHRQSEIG